MLEIKKVSQCELITNLEHRKIIEKAANLFINSENYSEERDGFITYITDKKDLENTVFSENQENWELVHYFSNEKLYEIVIVGTDSYAFIYFIDENAVSISLNKAIEIEKSLILLLVFENYLGRFGELNSN